MNHPLWLLFPPFITVTMIIIVVVENLDCNDLDLNPFKKSKWKNYGIKVGLNIVMDDKIVVDSTVRIFGMSLFSNPF